MRHTSKKFLIVHVVLILVITNILISFEMKWLSGGTLCADDVRSRLQQI